MKNITFYSGLYQDCFAYNLLAGSGCAESTGEKFFLDVGCHHPVLRNNTILFERLGWEGFCFDIVDCEQVYGFREARRTPFLQMDTASKEFYDFLKKRSLPTVDYISLDVDADSLAALENIINAKVRFKCMTFEHDYLKIGETIRGPSRKLLESEGYEMLFPDISFSHEESSPVYPGKFFEDWWIDPSFFPEDIVHIKETGLNYYEAVEILKAFMGNEYNATYEVDKKRTV